MRRLMIMCLFELRGMTMIIDQLRTACENRCGEVGDPSCVDLLSRDDAAMVPLDLSTFDWCAECLRDCGIEPPERFDPDAAVGLLL